MEDLEMEVFKQIGSRIRAERVKQKMSQAELAEKAHLCLPQISALELGKVKMNLYTFIKLVEALQVSADFLKDCLLTFYRCIFSNKLGHQR